jgi:hypothetical protein
MGPPRRPDEQPIGHEIQANGLSSSQSARAFAALFALVSVILLLAVLLLSTWLLVGRQQEELESTESVTVTRQLDP